MAIPTDPLRPLLLQLLDIQAERAVTYTLFDRGYQEYMATHPTYDFEAYRKLVALVAENFAELSEKVRSISNEIDRLGRSDLSQTIGHMQELERHKLQLTVDYQLAGKAYLDEEVATDDRIRDLKRKLGQLVASITVLTNELRDEITDE